MSVERLKPHVPDPSAAIMGLWKRHKARHLRGKSMEDVFTGIYRGNGWGNSESRSGTASSRANTEAVRSQLPALTERFGVRTLLDIPCGDFHWMREVALDLETYIGADIVDELLARNRGFEDDVRRFVKLDITRDPLPNVDLVLCRDCLIHFSLDSVARALDNIKASGSRYLLTTTFTRPSRTNIDIITGQWQTLNLQRPPFDLPAPIALIREGFASAGRRYADRSLAMWRISDL